MTNPFLNAMDAASRADLVVLGEIDPLEGSSATMRVLEVLRAPAGISVESIRVESSRLIVTPGQVWYFFLDGADPRTVLYASSDRRTVERLLAGMPASEPSSTLPELRVLFESASVVVEGCAVTVDRESAKLEVYEILKGAGQLDGPLSSHGRIVVAVRVDPENGEPGGGWTFGLDDYCMTVGVVGIYFLERLDEHWCVQNPAHPGRLTLDVVRQAVALDP